MNRNDSQHSEPWDNRDIPERYRRYSLDDFLAPVRCKVMEFLSEPLCWSMFMSGGLGSGKSTLAAAALLHVRKTIYDKEGRFVPPYVFARVVRNFDGEQGTLDQWFKTRLLVLDDVGATRDTEHLTEKLLHLLQHRYDHLLKTIITSNLSIADFAAHVDPRAASRLQEGAMLDLGTVDQRRKQG